MSNKLQAFKKNAAPLMRNKAADKLLFYNDESIKYGLMLTKEQAIRLLEAKDEELRYHGRLEFGEGIIGKLIKAFCDSPYMNKQNYSETLERLLEIFYYYKNETDEKLSDNELIDYMKTFFNGSCEGSLELLESRELDSLARALRRK
jgi:hypothetical protein